MTRAPVLAAGGIVLRQEATPLIALTKIAMANCNAETCARSLSSRIQLTRNSMIDALLPVLTILGTQFSFLLAGGVIIENVFFLPGLGRLVFQAIVQRDLIVVQSVVLILVFAVVSVTFLVDLAYVLVNPQLRAARGA